MRSDITIIVNDRQRGPARMIPMLSRFPSKSREKPDIEILPVDVHSMGAGRAPLAIVSAVAMSDRIEFGSMLVGWKLPDRVMDMER